MQKTLKSWRVRPVWPLTTTAIGVCVPPVMVVERGTSIGHRRRLFFQIEFSGSPGGRAAGWCGHQGGAGARGGQRGRAALDRRCQPLLLACLQRAGVSMEWVASRFACARIANGVCAKKCLSVVSQLTMSEASICVCACYICYAVNVYFAVFIRVCATWPYRRVPAVRRTRRRRLGTHTSQSHGHRASLKIRSEKKVVGNGRSACPARRPSHAVRTHRLRWS